MSWIQSAFRSKISSPVILFIIVLLAVILFVAALLHLLIRFILKHQLRSPNSLNYPQISNSTAFQRQLQHLFNLHDSGLDQAYIDALPVFSYKDIVMGSKEPFDCAVCLCEFVEDDRLRLLPLCSHAFHIDCIDTWLLSNSSCPLCRGVILSCSFENPVFGFEDCKENEIGVLGDGDCSAVISDKRVFSVRLGKFKSTNNNSNCENQECEAGETSNGDLGARRCFSMGSFQYVVGDSELQVALCTASRESRESRDREGQIGNFTSDADGKKINSGSKGESFSVSKIWQWSKKGKFSSSTSATHYSNAINVSLP